MTPSLLAGLPAAADPTTEEARRLLQEELSRAAYHQEPVLDRILGWIMDRLDALTAGPGEGAGAFSPWVTALVAVLVIALLAWVLPKVQRERRVRTAGEVLSDLVMTADQYRQRAGAALAAGDLAAALLDGFRAIARDAAARTLLDDAPGRTAHEIGAALAGPFPAEGADLVRAASLFDSVRYGGHRPTAPEVQHVLDLDRSLALARPVLGEQPVGSPV